MRNHKGFTLIEMLTVVLIVGILTAVALPQYSRAIKKSRATEAIAMLRVIHDSGERLAASLGYRDFEHVPYSKAVFNRLDMFDSSTISCSFTPVGEATVMTCDHYKYFLKPGESYITAQSIDGKTDLYLKRQDIPEITCYSEIADQCDLYNLTAETNRKN